MTDRPSSPENARPAPSAPPTARQIRINKFLQFLRKFWVAGAAGAFFAALSHNLPVDLMNLGKPSSLPFPYANFFLQYGFVFWLLLYFCVSSFDVDAGDKHDWLDVVFDVTQSLLALVAAFKLLIFVNPDPQKIYESQMLSYEVACVVILFVSVMTWALFSRETPFRPARQEAQTPRPKAKEIDRLRGLAAFFAVLSLLVIWIFSKQEAKTALLWLGILQAALWCILGRYAYLTATDA
jgi:hypothetical protein